jgi:hypothetical protein
LSNDLYENFEKRGVVEKRGEEETKSMPHVPVVYPSAIILTSLFIVCKCVAVMKIAEIQLS